MKILLSIFVLIISFSTYASSECINQWDDLLSKKGDLGEYSELYGLCDNDLKEGLKDLVSTNRDLGYTGARHAMFSEIDNVNGVVCSVYVNYCLRTSGIPNHRKMNCEHSWPQSLGATGIAKSDIHHLYPADSGVNSRRSNHPFCEVENEQWEDHGSRHGTTSGKRCFEPTGARKGDIARSMLYFSMRYSKKVDSMQEGFFKSWNYKDEVSEKEIERNELIDEVQGNRNPFVDVPEFIDMISDF